ncbi:helix-turn-helix domain-containing protein [Nonomuraea sp. NPDC047897]|uniref:helix-turn-helix domain-containing protein n=1 Tax=Nonomuraea sp. NPDC047897 TaxID=3364346 RepID=UPI00370FE825
MTAKITLTFELATAPAVEAATELIEAWVNQRLNLTSSWLRPLKVQALHIHGEGPDAVEMRLALAAKRGHQLAQRRRELRLTQRQLARRAGVTQTAVSQVESGRTGLGSKSAIAIRQALAAAEAGR